MSYFDRIEKEPCHHNHNHDQHHSIDDCVCDTVRNIVRVQNEVDNDGCAVSCERAIQQLRRPRHKHGSRYNTIPFVLYCKGTCKPFIGNGIFKKRDHRHRRPFYGCVESPVFRAKHFVKNSKCCVVLELLVPVSDDHKIDEACMNQSRDGGVCSFFPERNSVRGFLATGICLTVDLDNFMGISCLDPINPM